MASPPTHRLRQEADLLERFTQTYRRKFAELIDRLNAADAPPSDFQCVRLCVEAVNMMLASQTEVARTLREISARDPMPVSKAA
ncbi:MAG TPA: hypothetical protein VH475_27985 [Tepidisphaeraceae bacterium]|jgi:hypothetical protein